MRVLTVLSILVASVFAQEPADRCAMEEVVLDAAAGSPLKGAAVQLVKYIVQNELPDTIYEVKSDAKGGFTFRRLAPGRYGLRAEKVGYGLYQNPFLTVDYTGSDCVSGLQLKIRPDTVITGRILDDEGEPVRKAIVHMCRVS